MTNENNTLKADKGKLIMHVNKLCANTEIALGKEADISEWIEIDLNQWDFETDKFIEIPETQP